jgi:hypothetical protein
MKNDLVSVRMPKGMVDELKSNASANHFMDLSEELRFIIKQNFLKYNDPYEYEIKKFKDEIKKEISEKNEETRVKFIIELKNMLEEMKSE